MNTAFHMPFVRELAKGPRFLFSLPKNLRKEDTIKWMNINLKHYSFTLDRRRRIRQQTPGSPHLPDGILCISQCCPCGGAVWACRRGKYIRQADELHTRRSGKTDSSAGGRHGRAGAGFWCSGDQLYGSGAGRRGGAHRCTKTIYGGSYNLLAHTLPRYGISTTFVDAHDLSQVEEAITDNTKAVYLETLGNPNSDIPNIDAIAEIAHKHGLPLVVDNTFGTPYLIRPIEHGADIVVHSATKFIGGHGTTLGALL